MRGATSHVHSCSCSCCRSRSRSMCRALPAHCSVSTLLARIKGHVSRSCGFPFRMWRAPLSTSGPFGIRNGTRSRTAAREWLRPLKEGGRSAFEKGKVRPRIKRGLAAASAIIEMVEEATLCEGGSVKDARAGAASWSNEQRCPISRTQRPRTEESLHGLARR
jgi:hypothetical protein